jgi:hypothetical protein
VLDRQTGQEKWRRDYEISWIISSPAIFDNMLFTGTSDGRFAHALDLNSGKVVYFGSDDGYLYALAGTDSRVSPSHSMRRAVYWEASTGFNVFKFGLDEHIRDYFVRENYQKLNAKALAQFMEAGITDKTPSVVVFAASRVPATVVDDSSDSALLRRYLNAGGKIVFLGPPPLAYKRDPKTDQVIALDFTIPERILGIRYPGNGALGVGGWYQSTVTTEGIKWGLVRDWWIGGFAVDADQVTTVLAQDETGRASAWVKNYGGPEGTGLVQLWHKRDGQEDLIAIQAVAEYGLR